MVALADDPDEPTVDREVLAIEPERLAHPQPGRVKELKERPGAKVRRRFGLGTDPYLLYVGRVDPAKGADDIVKGGHVNPLKAKRGVIRLVAPVR